MQYSEGGAQWDNVAAVMAKHSFNGADIHSKINWIDGLILLPRFFCLDFFLFFVRDLVAGSEWAHDPLEHNGKRGK